MVTKEKKKEKKKEKEKEKEKKREKEKNMIAFDPLQMQLGAAVRQGTAFRQAAVFFCVRSPAGKSGGSSTRQMAGTERDTNRITAALEQKKEPASLMQGGPAGSGWSGDCRQNKKSADGKRTAGRARKDGGNSGQKKA